VGRREEAEKAVERFMELYPELKAHLKK